MAGPAVRTLMVTLEAILPMMSQIASRTRSCTTRTITEASVSLPEIAPATPPVIRRCSADPAWRDLSVAVSQAGNDVGWGRWRQGAASCWRTRVPVRNCGGVPTPSGAGTPPQSFSASEQVSAVGRRLVVVVDQ